MLYSGELFAGVGGLGRAVDEVFGSTPRWFAEYEAAPSKALAHHYPGVPNLGDVTRIDFRSAPHTHVRAGGFPCQDVSLAGARRGLSTGTRSGLWSEFARSIAEDRPDWVVIENVRGLASAEAHSDVEPCSWCLGDGAHEHALRALGAVLGDLADLGFDAEWVGLRAADIAAPHGRFRIIILAWPSDRTVANDDDGAGLRGVGRVVAERRDADGRGGADEAGVGAESAARLTLLGTPRVSSGNGAGNLERRQATTNIESQVLLLPTPLVSDGTGGSKNIAASEFSPQMRDIAKLLPTPGAHDGDRGGSQHPDKRRAGGHSIALQDVAEHITDWGKYAAAVARWEAVLGRPVPAPVRHDGKGGKARLNPELTEWMMGWPAGWVTDPEIGLTRSEQLKACGNGVVTLQAVHALRTLLTRPGVPAIDVAEVAA